MMSANDKLLHELKGLKNKLKKADLISYLSLAHWLYYREETENKFGLNLSLIRDLTTNEGYGEIETLYATRELTKKIEWVCLEETLRNNIKLIYSNFKGLEKQNLDNKDKEWFNNYADQLVSEIGNLPHNGKTTILDYARGRVLSFIDDYVKKAKKKNAYVELKFLNKLIGGAISHDMAS